MITVGSRLGVESSRISLSTRLAAFRASGLIALLAALILATLAFLGGLKLSEVPAGWPVLFGLVMVGSFAGLPLQAAAISRQIAAELRDGYTTDRHGTSSRPAVAAGTDVVIREAGRAPLPRGDYRLAKDWARGVREGVIVPPPFPQPSIRVSKNGADGRLGQAAAWAAVAYLVGLGAVWAGLLPWPLGFWVGLLSAVAVCLVFAIIYRRST